jgi:carbamoyltransferase
VPRRKRWGARGDHYGAHDCAPNPLFYELIDRFRAATGVPMLLNTSLNGKDEPLVETPDDALRFWKSSPIDIMVIGDAMFRR